MSVIKSNEIELNSIKYPLTDKVRPILSAKFAEKMVVGDYTKASNPEVDSWVIQDQRGGILAEEMDEERQADRAWWSTCNLGFLGHTVLPPKPSTAIALTAPKLTSPTGHTENADWADEAKAYDLNEITNYAETSGTIAAAGWSPYLTLTIAATDIVAVKVIANVVNDDVGSLIDIDVWDGGWQSVANDKPLLSTAAWGIPCTRVFAAAYTGVTKVQMRLKNNAAGANKGQIYEFYFITATGGTAGTLTDAVEYQNNLYFAHGVNLNKLDGAGTGLTTVNVFSANITALVSDGSYLYIYLGDTAEYFYYDGTNDWFRETDDAEATLGIYWDNKLIKIDSVGKFQYAAASPADDATDWTDGDTLPLTDNYLKSLFLYRNAAGNVGIYAGTRTGLWAYDFTNAIWIQTELSLPDHPTCGMGTVHWRDASYTSAGLDVLRYQTGGSGTSIASVGLDQDDGLPKLRGGEIVKFIKGYNEFFALVDSVYEGATSRSTVMAYDGKGWQCWWESGSNNVHMYSGIVSSVSAYRLWFGAGANIYYIALQRNLRNPKKVTGFNYHTAGVHITPWFDANWVGTKLALQFKVFCKDVTANETVVVDYRIDHIEVDLTTGWNNLGTIVAAGNEVETTYTFGSSLGTNFKAIQFKFTLANTTSTLSPDIQYAVLEYQKIIKPTWGWAFTIDCTKEYNNRTANQMLDAVVTAAELEVLTPFLYKDTTYYVRVKSVEGERLTGDGRKGTYNVTVLKPI